METRYNTRSPAVKRLMREASELSSPTFEYFAQPLDDNLFEWHFTVRGPPESDFQGGIYHGRIILPTEYPMKPPNIIVTTPNGRFQVGKKICLSISGHHPESWQPSWSIRTALLAIIGFMPTPGQGTIGSLDYTPDERKTLARQSVQFHCEQCGITANLLKNQCDDDTQGIKEETKEIMKNMSFKGEEEVESEKQKWETKEEEISEDTLKNETEEERERRVRKRLCKAAQDRFRDKLRLRTNCMTTTSASPRASSSTPSPAPQPTPARLTPQPARPAQRNIQQQDPGWTWTDFVISFLVLCISLIIYRRIGGFKADSIDHEG